jgi:hypothetical protein
MERRGIHHPSTEIPIALRSSWHKAEHTVSKTHVEAADQCIIFKYHIFPFKPLSSNSFYSTYVITPLPSKPSCQVSGTVILRPPSTCPPCTIFQMKKRFPLLTPVPFLPSNTLPFETDILSAAA